MVSSNEIKNFSSKIGKNLEMNGNQFLEGAEVLRRTLIVEDSFKIGQVDSPSTRRTLIVEDQNT